PVETYLLRYRLCRAGFALIALGLSLLCLDMACHLAIWMTRDGKLLGMIQHPLWSWMVGAPITWSTLLGSYLLWGRWTEPGWQRRAGLLVFMNFIDLIQWAVEHGDALGLRLGTVGHPWLRYQLGGLFNWVELALCASLAADVSAHLGRTDAPQAGQTSRAFAIVGLVLGLVLF